MTYKATISTADGTIYETRWASEADAWAFTTDACDCNVVSCTIEPDPHFVGPAPTYEA